MLFRAQASSRQHLVLFPMNLCSLEVIWLHPWLPGHGQYPILPKSGVSTLEANVLSSLPDDIRYARQWLMLLRSCPNEFFSVGVWTQRFSLGLVQGLPIRGPWTELAFPSLHPSLIVRHAWQQVGIQDRKMWGLLVTTWYHFQGEIQKWQQPSKNCWKVYHTIEFLANPRMDWHHFQVFPGFLFCVFLPRLWAEVERENLQSAATARDLAGHLPA